MPEASAPAKRSVTLSLLNQPLLALLFCWPVAGLLAQTPTPVTVPTWRYDLTHQGQNTNETALTPANVNINSFGKLFSLATDGAMYAQPLYVPGLKMSDGLAPNVLFVASEHDSVYAFDADSNGGVNANPIWHITLLDQAHGAGSSATTVPNGDIASTDIIPEIGITGTPVINPATNTMYVVRRRWQRRRRPLVSCNRKWHVRGLSSIDRKHGTRRQRCADGGPPTIPATGMTASGVAYVGFTGGIGGESVTTQILSWTLANPQ